MNPKVKLHMVDQDGKRVSKVRLFITARPALLRWQINLKDKAKTSKSSYFRRIEFDEYLELTPKETMHILDWLKTSEVNPEELTIDGIVEILSRPHIESPEEVLVT